MKFVALVLVLVCLFASAQAQVNWKSTCTGTFAIGSVTITPDNLTPGATVTVSFSGTLNKAITSGQVSAVISWNGTPFPAIKQDLCSIDPNYHCPLATGAQSFTVSQALPPFLPPGSYAGDITITDQDNAQVACIQLTFNIGSNVIAEAAPVLDDEIISYVNQIGSWEAARNPRFEGLTMKDVKGLLGTKLADFQSVPKVAMHAEAIPNSFDARTQWPNCIHPIRNQEQCGSCWAFGATEALSDRFCIASNGKINVVLSPEYLVSCDKSNYGCQGGYLDAAWQYMVNPGVVSDACSPYTAGNGNAPACPKKCSNGDALTFYKVKAGTIVQPKDVASIQTLIMTSGPVEAAFSVYQDFFAYKSGVYTHKSGGLAGGHAIKIVGWGVSGTQPYWIVANSWGTDWGLSGFFWIERGTNQCGIESNVIAADPAI